MKLTQQLTATAGPTLGQVTHLELLCFSRPGDVTGAAQLVENLAHVAGIFAARCPALTHFTLRARIRARPPGLAPSQSQPQAAEALPQLRLSKLLARLGRQLVAALSHLHVHAAVHHSSAWRPLLSSLATQDLTFLSNWCTKLTDLHLNTVTGGGMTWNALPASLHSLTLVSARSSPKLSSRLSNLRVLRLTGDVAASDAATVVQASPSLQHIHVQNITAPVSVQGLHDLWGSVRSGTSLHTLPGRPTVVHACGVKLTVPEAGADMALCEFLQQMPPMPDTVACLVVAHAAPVQAGAGHGPAPFLQHVSEVLPGLRSLRVRGCTLTDADLLTLCLLPQLGAVHLSGCIGLTTCGVVQLASKLHHLLVLEVHGCPGVGLMARLAVEKVLRSRCSGSARNVEERLALLMLQDSRRSQLHWRRRDTQRVRTCAARWMRRACRVATFCGLVRECLLLRDPRVKIRKWRAVSTLCLQLNILLRV